MLLPIYACGTLAGTFKRKNTERFKWDEAKTMASVWEAAGRWDRTAKLPPTAIAAAPAVGRISIVNACAVFISLREGEKIAAATLRKYRTFTKQLLAFADSLGYVMLDQMTSRDADLFYGSLKLGGRAKAKRLGTLRAFFRFCVNREWLPKSPVSGDLRPPLGSSRVGGTISDDLGGPKHPSLAPFTKPTLFSFERWER